MCQVPSHPRQPKEIRINLKPFLYLRPRNLLKIPQILRCDNSPDTDIDRDCSNLQIMVEIGTL
jgi:hypothetical protein